MPQPIELLEVDKLIVLYYRRLAHTSPDKPTSRRSILLKTIQVLEHYRDLCTIIDSPIEYIIALKGGDASQNYPQPAQ